MKHITAIFLLLVPMTFYAQWSQLNSDNFENLNDIFCINENTVITVGDNGTILKTTDGGENWIQIISGTNFNLSKIEFANSNVGYIAGNYNNNGVLLKTTDGGENWTTIQALGTSFIYDFSVIDENLLYLTNLNGILKKTTNGGNSFETVNTNNFPERLQFINEQIGYASSGFSLLKTIDSGLSWTEICPIDFYPANGAFYFLNEQVGFVNTTASLTRTIDGGQNFQYLDNIEFPIFKLFATTENIIWGVAFESVFNSETPLTIRGEIIENNSFNRIQSFPILKSLHFANQINGYAVSGEKIFKNTTGTMLNNKQVSKKESAKVYPNPASDHIEIYYNKISEEPYSVKIINYLDQEVYTKNSIQTDLIKIDTKAFSKGIYILTIIENEKSTTQKVIIK